MPNQPFIRTQLANVLPPPKSEVGPLAWARANLFSGPVNGLLTIVGFSLLAYAAFVLLDFLVVRAVWTGENRDACLGAEVGACWPFIKAKFGQLVYGFYPADERWRPNLVFLLGAILVVPLLALSLPFKKLNAFLFFVVYPVVSFYLLQGDAFGLPLVSTRIWGGILVTLVVAVVGIVASLPIGIVLALGRRSKLPIIRFASVAFIEFWRGVPLITVLFFATYMLPLFLPRGTELNGLLRALVGVSLFAAAYMAEVVRGGLQAIPRGQYEGAMAVGLGYWRMMFLIILPQALKLVIPGIVNTFIGLFKDTTLVLIVSILDLLGQLRAAFADPNWATPVTEFTGYAFAGFFYFFFCYGMSRYSRYVERRLNTGHKR
jgi:general L-amino acid transport system permease protein